MTEPDPEDPPQHPKRVERPNATCPKHPKKEYRRLVKAAWRAGWWCERNRKNYIYCYPPTDVGVVMVPSSPRKQGTLNRVTDKFRKMGLDLS